MQKKPSLLRILNLALLLPTQLLIISVFSVHSQDEIIMDPDMMDIMEEEEYNSVEPPVDPEELFEDDYAGGDETDYEDEDYEQSDTEDDSEPRIIPLGSDGWMTIESKPLTESVLKSARGQVFGSDDDGYVAKTSSNWVTEAHAFHNKLRKLHVAGRDLEDDSDLVNKAERWALDLAQMTEAAGFLILKNDPTLRGGMGENLSAVCGKSREELKKISGRIAIYEWYAEIKHYDWERNYYQSNTGHFTQLIWRASQTVGCARAVSYNKCLIVVCRYRPAGNHLIRNAFRHHVKPPLHDDPNHVPSFRELTEMIESE